MSGCNFRCKYLDENDVCEPMETECIGDMCDEWEVCDTCELSQDCPRNNLKD